MTAVAATDFFLALCERVGERANTDIDALAVGQELQILAPVIFSHVDELKRRGWLEESPVLNWGHLMVRVTLTGLGHYASEKRRRRGVTWRGEPR